MRTAFSPYTLYGINGFPDREGALLRFTFSDGNVGYADCHPWIERGDFPLSDQLDRLKYGRSTPLTCRSLYFAKLDAEARRKNISLFKGVRIPKSHMLIGNESLPSGISPIKIKNPDLFLRLAPQLPNDVRVRLDFNYKMGYETFRQFCVQVTPWIERIDFIEDPFPFDRTLWETIEADFNVRLACDQESDKYPYPLSVIKPAVQDPLTCEADEIIVTSYLDHPIGQTAAAYCAAKLSLIKKVGICGLLSHVVYKKTSWSECLGIQDLRLVPSLGTGFGFDELLESEKWQSL